MLSMKTIDLLFYRNSSKYSMYKMFIENTKGNFSGSKPINCRKITLNPEKIGPFDLEQFFYILYNTVCILKPNILSQKNNFNKIFS